MTLHYTRNHTGNYDILDETNTIVAQTVNVATAERFVKSIDAGRLAIDLLKMANDEEDV